MKRDDLDSFQLNPRMLDDVTSVATIIVDVHHHQLIYLGQY